MKTLKQYEEQLKKHAFKSHDLALEADVVSIDTALHFIEDAINERKIKDRILRLIRQAHTIGWNNARDEKITWSETSVKKLEKWIKENEPDLLEEEQSFSEKLTHYVEPYK